METISWRRAATVPYVCQRIGARSGKDSRFLDNSRRTPSRFENETVNRQRTLKTKNRC